MIHLSAYTAETYLWGMVSGAAVTASDGLTHTRWILLLYASLRELCYRRRTSTGPIAYYRSLERATGTGCYSTFDQKSVSGFLVPVSIET
jgi:hypothetical protein